MHFHGDINAHYAAFQDDVDLSTFYPFYAHVAFFSSRPHALKLTWSMSISLHLVDAHIPHRWYA
jgi:hypothetical protein